MEVAAAPPQSAFMTRRTPWFLLVLLVPAAQPAELPAITVHLFNLAGAQEGVLAQAMDITTGIYAEAGIPLRWVRQPAPIAKLGPGIPFRPNLTPTEVSIRLLPKHLSDQMVRPGSRWVGIAYPVGQNDFRYLATLLYDRVELAAQSLDDVSMPVLLGYLMAHELGHLLLGPDAHARTTIMACPWDTTEFRVLRRGQLRFNRHQATKLRSNVANRIEAADSKGSPDGPRAQPAGVP
jgi:hypothetical protein